MPMPVSAIFGGRADQLVRLPAINFLLVLYSRDDNGSHFLTVTHVTHQLIDP